MRGLIELERIGKGRVETTPEHADGLEAGDGAHHHPAADHGQILAFKQHEAQIAGDIGMFEIGLVGDPRRKNGDAVVRVQPAALQRVAELAKEAGQPVDVAFGIKIGEGTRGRDPVLQGEAGARRCLGAIGQDPPVTVGSTANLEGDEMQEVAVGRFHADERAQELRIGGDQRRRQQPFAHQPVLAIDVGDHLFQKFGALHEALRDVRPFLFVDQNRNVRQRPASLGTLLGAVDAIEHAGVAQIAVGAREAVGKFGLVEPPKRREQPLPDRADIALLVEHFVGNAR